MAKPKATCRIDISRMVSSVPMDAPLRKRLAATRTDLARSATFIRRFEASLNSLEAKDRLGNFEIQRLMPACNQAATPPSNVMKKQDETASAIVRHIASRSRR